MATVLGVVRCVSVAAVLPQKCGYGNLLYQKFEYGNCPWSVGMNITYLLAKTCEHGNSDMYRHYGIAPLNKRCTSIRPFSQ